MTKPETSQHEIHGCVEQLTAVLDRDIRYLEETVARLDELRRLVVRQDDEALTQLLETIRSESRTCRDNEAARQHLRQKLAGLLGCELKQITLSRIEERLTQAKCAEIRKRKDQLQTLVGRLKREYISTQMLLTDCARFNRMLLNCLLEAGQSKTMAYNASGAVERHADTVLMNMEF